MSTKWLGERFEVHTGGVDNIFPHHEDERAQSETALGHEVVGIWLHGQHLLLDGVKMAKSTGNVYDRRELERRGYEPLAFRYLCATVRPRSRMNFTFESLRASQRALDKLRARVDHAALHAAPRGGGRVESDCRQRFAAAINDDLNLPAALASTWQVARSAELSPATRSSLLVEFDQVLGLGLHEGAHQLEEATARAASRIDERTVARMRRQFAEADRIRRDLAEKSVALLDRREGTDTQLRHQPRDQGWIASSDDVPSNIGRPDEFEFSLCLIARDNGHQVRRCLDSLASYTTRSAEAIVVDSVASEECRQQLADLSPGPLRLEILRADHDLGTGGARNVALRRALGEIIVVLDTSMEATGDLLTPIKEALEDPEVGLVGPYGVRSVDLRDFAEADGEVDAIEGYLMAFRRSLLSRVGLMDERFRFYRHLDLDYSMRFRAEGLTLRTIELPLKRHALQEWEGTAPEERERLSKRNFYRFLKHWGDRHDLLVRR
jgi:cysteinyl-tRNA synthetase